MTQQKNFLRFISKSPMYSHWLPVMVVLLGTGLRVGECTGLTKNDVDLENNTISVNHNLIYRVIDGEAGFHITTPKTASGTRTIPILYPQVAEQLRALIEVMDALYPEDLVMNGYHGFLFRNRSGYFLSAHNINRAIERISIAYNAITLKKWIKQNWKTVNRISCLISAYIIYGTPFAPDFARRQTTLSSSSK